MAVLKPEIDGSSIVLIGSFNPAIFQPAWFAQQELLRKEEAAAAEIEAITKDFSVFSIEWLQVQVFKNRFASAARDEGHAAVLRDLVVGTFRLLEHTPVTAMGLNRQMHFGLETEDAWHLIGDTLAPKERWHDLLSGHVGMRSLTIEGQRRDASSKYVRIMVQPSIKVPRGVFVEYNEHFETGEESGLGSLMQALEDSWDVGQVHALASAQKLLSGIIRQGD